MTENNKQQAQGKGEVDPGKPKSVKSKPAKKEKVLPPPSEVVLEVGQPAPSFELDSDHAGKVSLEGLKGQKVLLYFYPRDSTPGCTTQARDFTALLPQFKAKNTVVLGVSTDSLASHERFRERNELELILLSDPEAEVARAYGAWKEKSLYGRKFVGMVRSTFLIDENGVLAAIWPKVRVKGHAEEVLSKLA